MTELTGGLIQMNSHMVVTSLAGILIGIGVGICVLFLICGIASAMCEERKLSIFMFAIAIVGIIVTIVGVNMPRVKEIHACADGQVSIEQIGVRYDIVKIDGKELVLRER